MTQELSGTTTQQSLEQVARGLSARLLFATTQMKMTLVVICDLNDWLLNSDEQIDANNLAIGIGLQWPAVTIN